MRVFIKAQAASLTASAVDFLITTVLVKWVGVYYMAATVLGTISGGIVNFIIGRHWVFEGRNKEVKVQSIKYLFVWCGNLLLNAAGVFLFTQYVFGIKYIILSKIIVSVLVGFFYNYFLQKRFVFK
ncbi:GtrA family protein [Chitinophagaceae bacterium LWZ2-11]